MPAPKLTESQFVNEWHIHGAQGIADRHSVSLRSVLERRARLAKTGIELPTKPAPGYESRVPLGYRDANEGWTFPREKELWLDSGSAVIFSDAHYWPGLVSVAHSALLAVIKAVKPRAVFANGDIFDGVSVSRHDPFGWGGRPSVRDEMDACKERLGEIEQAIPNGCELLWNIGNHDVRFERTLASKVPEFATMDMMRLSDHFPAWDMRWSTKVNWQSKHPVIVKHRYAGGVHAGYNNTMKGGTTIVTGHTHLLEAKPWGDYRGRRWGIQTGTLADVDGPQFEYQENAPSAACSGFVVLTFHDGILAPPEICEVINGKAWFRGEVVA